MRVRERAWHAPHRFTDQPRLPLLPVRLLTFRKMPRNAPREVALWRPRSLRRLVQPHQHQRPQHSTPQALLVECFVPGQLMSSLTESSRLGSRLDSTCIDSISHRGK